MITCIKLLLSFLTTYLFGRLLFLTLCNSKDQSSLISKIHSYCLGLYITSLLFWFFTVISNGNIFYYPSIELFSVFIIYLLYRKYNSIQKNKNFCPIKKLKSNLSTIYILETIIGIFILLLVSFLFLIRGLKFPNGTWDAVAMWNLKAKYLCCGNEQWLDFLSQSFSYAHTDYPLFLPCILARTSSYIGEFKSTQSLWIKALSIASLKHLESKIGMSFLSTTLFVSSITFILNESKKYNIWSTESKMHFRPKSFKEY